MRSIKDIDVCSKRVMVRVDYNLPMDENLNISDDNRIRQTLPTIHYLIEKRAKVILIAHMGRPKGKLVPSLSLRRAAVRLSEIIEKKVDFVSDCIGPEVEKSVSELSDGDILLLENLRFYEGEKSCDPDFVRKLSSLCDIYVNDAFAVSHRKEASVTALPKAVTESVAGLLLEKELRSYHDAVENPVRPLVAVIGGSKVSSKLEALENMLSRVDTLIIGGAMANTFLKSRGFDTGASMVEEDLVETALNIVTKAEKSGVRLLLPVDLVAASAFDKDADKITVELGSDKFPEGWSALDIGIKSAELFSSAIAGAGTVVWNGPMGVFEMERFREGTCMVANAIASSGAFSVIGGGDTGLAAKVCGIEDKVSYISTGGGAFLHLMEGKELPGKVALERE